MSGGSVNADQQVVLPTVLQLRLQGDQLVPLNAAAPLPMPAALLAGPDGAVLSFGIAGALPLATAAAKPEATR